MRAALIALCLLPMLATADDAATRRAQDAETKLQAELAEQKAARDEADRYWSDRDAAEAKRRRADMDKIEADVAKAQREEARQDGIRRKVCGADYAHPAVGMTLVRARQCVGDLVEVGQVNRADGVATVYRSGRLELVAMGGRIVAWRR